MTISIDAVYDIETIDWTEFLCGSLWTRKHGTRVFHDPDELADAILAIPRGQQVWAHAGGKFDFLWLLDHLIQRGDKPRASIACSGGSATSVRFSDGPHLRDSMRLIPMSLASAAKIAGEHRAKGDAGIAFDQMTRNMPRAVYDRIVDYCVADTELLRDILLALVEYAEQHHIDLKGTVGGSAWATASEWCGLEPAEWPEPRVYSLAADGYKGGLCAVGKLETTEVYRYDRKSAYPASIMLPVPIGKRKALYGQSAARAFAAHKPGVYQARVTMPESLVPSLPIIMKNRLMFPHGKLLGTWTHHELAFAESRGATIDKIDGGVTWQKESAILAPFARRAFDLRDSLPEWNKKGLGAWLKFLANSFTGKTGQSPDTTVIVIGNYADDFEYKSVGISEHVWSRNVWRIPDCAHVQFAATLTARARIELIEQIEHAGSSWVYSDTDSCFAERPLTRNTGIDLGQWDFEGIGRDWHCAAPKVYSYLDGKSGKDVLHAKGVRIDQREQWERYVSGQKVEDNRGVKTLAIAAREGERLFVKKHLARALSEEAREGDWVGGRLRCGNVTRAPHVSDLANR